MFLARNCDFMELYDKIVLFFRMKIPIGHGKNQPFSPQSIQRFAQAGELAQHLSHCHQWW
jgi:hypothetical protein